MLCDQRGGIGGGGRLKSEEIYIYVYVYVYIYMPDLLCMAETNAILDSKVLTTGLQGIPRMILLL